MESVIIEKVFRLTKESINDINNLSILFQDKKEKPTLGQVIWEIRLKVEYSIGLLNLYFMDGMDQIEKSISRPKDPLVCLSIASI